MASLPPLPHSLAQALPRRWAWAAFALALVVALRLMPLPGSLDAMKTASAPAPIATSPADTFPGSAYFLAEDAFAPLDATATDSDAPGVTTLSPANAHILQIERGPIALSMPMRAATPFDQGRALQCLTNALYYEAGNEPEEGQRAIAQVILNRIASGRWPASVCGTIYQGTERADRLCQFTFSCDGSMARIPDAAKWSRARAVAVRALSGETFAPAGLATFYHTLAVHPPWSASVRPVAVIGAHIFYRLPGEAGAPAGYRMRYAGRETAQPGPYAFMPPPRPLSAADMPADWAIPPVQPAAAPVIAPPVATPPAFAAAPTIRPSFIPEPLPRPAPARIAIPGEPTLPESTIRPEYRNSGRPLR